MVYPRGFAATAKRAMKSANAKVCHAYWESSYSGVVLLGRDWNDDRRKPPLMLGPDRLPFQTLERADKRDFARLSRYYRDRSSWRFVLHPDRYPQLKKREKRVFLAGEFNDWGEAIGKKTWELKPVSRSFETTYELRVSFRRIPPSRRYRFKFVTEDEEWLDAPESAPNWVVEENGVGNFELDPDCTGRHIFRFTVPEDYEPRGNEEVIWSDEEGEERVPFPPTQFLLESRTERRLGAWIEEGRTVFRLFAPRARAVWLRVGSKSDGSDARDHPMERSEGVCWECVFERDLPGWFYWYFVDGPSQEGTTHFDRDFPLLDPWARACLDRGGPAIVVPDDRLPPPERPFEAPAWHDLVILEGHVRDLAARAPSGADDAERLGYRGLERWVRTEASYLRELGANAVELQPVQEFDNREREEYHWGYMPVNFFAPESSYALDPANASQIEEFRDLVQAFHDAGMAVILDVVYNHVGEPNHLLFIDKYYYFHLDEAYDLLNWSGCGNDLRCDAPMARRLILESLEHLVRAYDVDGFRFDLAELIGIDVLRDIESELKAVKPSLVLIAEPWSFRGNIVHDLKETSFASWNDGFRDAIATYARGEGNQEMIRHFLSGSPPTSRFAAQTVNYTESHDDYCWLDRITERPGNDGSDPSPLDRRRTHLMGAILFSALGIPMLAEGQDFLRSKRGRHNTYREGELNALDYTRRHFYSGTHDYFAAWIRFRLSAEGAPLRVDGPLRSGYMAFYFADGFSACAALFNARREGDGRRLLFAVNPHFEYVVVPFDDVAPGELTQLADHERFAFGGLRAARFPVDADGLHLPPLACGLWRVAPP